MKHHLGTPYSIFYICVFMMMGIVLPFWPLWLKSRGISESDIGLILSIAPWIKILASPSIAYLSDRSGLQRTILSATALVSAACFLGFYFSNSFIAFLILQACAASTYLSLIPLGDSQTLRAVRIHNLDYGRIRLWGSLAFILTSFGVGYVLERVDVDWRLWFILIALVCVAGASWLLPSLPTEPTNKNIKLLLKNPKFLLFTLGAGMIIGSHAAYYAFISLYMQSLGYSESLIGTLWAIGVVAEILLFAFSDKLFKSARSLHLITLGAAAAVLRWLGLGLSESLVIIIALQLLHALTFGATHLGAMAFISRHAPTGLSASAQSLYSGVANGLMMGMAMLLSSWLYKIHPTFAFFAMAGFASIGGILTLYLASKVPMSSKRTTENITGQEQP
ncbi:major facilitator superfamily domain-containing protein 6 [Kiloniella laminariae]|uniref:Major facilitator superfamily domain-containing protein 6 n=1 Tax=Kiloniella laminariae TaxID=454162 RepID=A0ABT4LLJ8_9PROT|nr:major facilitator superfamily domain-containing protein 6 [Kiloniella laminariae]MCZ4281957.1 major facilitator superfamily domain-containing protein 6 [Kiloniella laminariae]